jgi:hypothetical protein
MPAKLHLPFYRLFDPFTRHTGFPRKSDGTANSIRAYLGLNAVFYSFLALRCAVVHGGTSKASGYIELTNSGHAEYLTVYGGLQLGLAFFYYYLASSSALYRTGAVFSALLYTSIVVFRVVGIARYWPVSNLMLAATAVEFLFLAGAIFAVTKTTIPFNR